MKMRCGPVGTLTVVLAAAACGEDTSNETLSDASPGTSGDAFGPDAILRTLDGGPADAPASDVSTAPNDAGPPRDATATTDTSSDAMVAAGCIKAVFGDHYIRSDGTIVHTQAGAAPVVVVDAATNQPLPGFVDGFESQWHACALRNDRTVWCWPKVAGNTLEGALGNGTSTAPMDADLYKATRVQRPPQGLVPAYLDDAIAIARGSSLYYHAPVCAVRADQSVVCWGPKTDGDLMQTGSDGLYATTIQAAPNTPLGNVTQVSVGRRHICVRLADATARCWGSDIGAPLGQPTPGDQKYPIAVPGLPAGVSTVGAGMDSSCAQAGDRVYCWGASGRGQIGNGVQAVGAGCANYCTRDATLSEQAPGTPLTEVAELTVVYLGVCARKTDDTVWCWGAESGATDVQRAQPLSLAGKPVVDVARLTSFGTAGFSTSLRYTTRAGDYYWASMKVSPMCP